MKLKNLLVINAVVALVYGISYAYFLFKKPWAI